MIERLVVVPINTTAVVAVMLFDVPGKLDDSFFVATSATIELNVVRNGERIPVFLMKNILRAEKAFGSIFSEVHRTTFECDQRLSFFEPLGLGLTLVQLSAWADHRSAKRAMKVRQNAVKGSKDRMVLQICPSSYVILGILLVESDNSLSILVVNILCEVGICDRFGQQVFHFIAH